MNVYFLMKLFLIRVFLPKDDEEPTDQVYAPDGGYIPRILFLSHLGEVVNTLYNEHGNPKYKYFYSSAESGF